MRKTILMVIFAVLIFSVVGCGQPKQSTPDTKQTASEKPITLVLNQPASAKTTFGIGADKFKEVLESKSKGKIKVEVYHDGTLGNEQQTINLLKEGKNIQLGLFGDYIASVAPKANVLFMPYIFTKPETAYKVLDGEIGKEVGDQVLEIAGVRILGWLENGYRNMTNSKKEILSPSDIKGLKIRTPQSPVAMATMKALGANVTPMPWGEVFTALEQKAVDGQENPASMIYSSKVNEVQKYLTLTKHQYAPYALGISEATWTNLSPENQKMIQEAVEEVKEFQRKKAQEDDAAAIQALKESGMKVTEPDLAPFIEATKDVHKEFDAKYGEDFYNKVLAAAK